MNWSEIENLICHSVAVAAFLSGCFILLINMILGISGNSPKRPQLILSISLLLGGGVALAGVHYSPFRQIWKWLPTRFRLVYSDGVPETWLVILVSLGAILIFANWKRSPRRTDYMAEAPFFLLSVAISYVLIVTTDIWLQWACLSAMSWLMCLTLACHNSDEFRSRRIASGLIWLIFADLVFLMGLSSLGFAISNSDLPAFSSSEFLQGLEPGTVAQVVSGLSLIVMALALRCGLYPLMSWTAPITMSFRETAWLILLCFGPAILVLIRWGRVLHSFPEVTLILQGVGALSAVLLGMMAWSHVLPAARTAHMVSSCLGIVWIAVGTLQFDLDQATRLGLGGVTLMAALAISFHLFQDSGISRGLAKWGMLGGGVLLCVGVLGQEALIETIRIESDHSPQMNWIYITGILISIFLVGLSLFRTIEEIHAFSQHSELVPGTDLPAVRGIGQITAGLTLITMMCLAIIFRHQIVDLFQLRGSVTTPILCGMVTAIAYVASRTWPHSQRAGRQQRNGLHRLAQAEFYVPSVIAIVVQIPIRGLVRFAHFSEWFFIGNCVERIPSTLMKWIGNRASLTDEEGTQYERAWRALSVIAVMLMGVALGMLM
ncbi:hypothetical protein SH668x_003332 [Planctomicrobium sp. SH668]|uniref:hypothetical protein n=1 Tax=Planctomicrobium sp. SH668 TaxID=3448126 RepID=UPI003F5C1FAB